MLKNLKSYIEKSCASVSYGSHTIHSHGGMDWVDLAQD